MHKFKITYFNNGLKSFIHEGDWYSALNSYSPDGMGFYNFIKIELMEQEN